MIITFKYSQDSNLAKTSPLIRGVAFQTIRDEFNSLANSLGLNVNHINLIFHGTKELKENDYEIHSSTSAEYARAFCECLYTHMDVNYPRINRGVSSFEILGDVYGTGNPRHIFTASTMDEMSV